MSLKPNKLSRYVGKIYQLPTCFHQYLLTKLFCSQVKFAKTTGIHIEQITAQQVKITLTNKKRVQNHIGGIHAVAAAVLAESATGLLLGLHVPDARLPLLKTMTLHYKRRMQGDLQALATLTEQQIAQIQHQEKGELMIAVVLTDESGQQPIICEMTWAWLPKSR
jgi:acyl-coenzyme A thioesterase PaaI-like protein